MILKINSILSAKSSIKAKWSKSKKIINSNISNYKILITKNISGIKKNIKLFKTSFKKENIDNCIKALNPKYKIEKVQDLIERKIKSNSEETVLQQAKFWAQTITWTLIGGTTFGIGWLAFAKTEEIVIAPGKLEPKGGVIEVQMPFQGITKELLVKEGEVVKKGQVLIKLDTEGAEIAIMKGALDTLKSKRPIIMAEIHPDDSKLDFLFDMGYEAYDFINGEIIKSKNYNFKRQRDPIFICNH